MLRQAQHEWLPLPSTAFFMMIDKRFPLAHNRPTYKSRFSSGTLIFFSEDKLSVTLIDLRRGIDGLSALVQQNLGQQPCAGSASVFHNGPSNRFTSLIKGIIVIAVELYVEIIKLKPEWHSDDLSKCVIKVVMTTFSEGGPKLAKHPTTKKQRKVLAERMKNNDDELKLVIVRDMWLTGFDAPSMHTLYKAGDFHPFRRVYFGIERHGA
jgi:IS66 Orf2 like protein